MSEKVLQVFDNHGKMLTVRNGFPICPHCNRGRFYVRVLPGATVKNVGVLCRNCKKETVLNIVEGERH